MYNNVLAGKTPHSAVLFLYGSLVLQITVVGTDGGTPPLSSSTVVTVDVIRNNPPVVEFPGSGLIDIDRNLGIQSVVFNFSATDGDQVQSLALILCCAELHISAII